MLLKDRQQTVSCSSLLCHLTISVYAPPHPQSYFAVFHPPPPDTPPTPLAMQRRAWIFYISASPNSPPPPPPPFCATNSQTVWICIFFPVSATHTHTHTRRDAQWLMRRRCHATADRKLADSYHSDFVEMFFFVCVCVSASFIILFLMMAVAVKPASLSICSSQLIHSASNVSGVSGWQ